MPEFEVRMEPSNPKGDLLHLCGVRKACFRSIDPIIKRTQVRQLEFAYFIDAVAELSEATRRT